MTRRGSQVSLLALTIGAGLLLSPASALAKDPELYFYPAKPWTIGSSPVSAAGITGNEACSIQSEFNNGFVVQIDGSERWVEQMSVDFRQDAFTAGQSYDVTLNVPGVKNKVITAQASSTNMLLINLHGQKDFYQAMRDSAVFDMNIENNNFRFYMVGFAGPAKGFERCMAGGPATIPASQEELREAAASPDATVNESIAMEQKETQKLAAITEILPEDPQVTVQEIPYTETVKVGDQPVSTTQKIPGEEPVEVAATADPQAPEAAPEQDVAPVTAPEPAPAPAPAPALAAAPPGEFFQEEPVAPGMAPPPKQKRLSEMLASQIEANPEIAAVDSSMDERKNTEIMKSEPILVPEENVEITISAEAPPEAAAPVEPVAQEITAPAPQETVPEAAPEEVASADEGIALTSQQKIYQRMAEAQLSGVVIPERAPEPVAAVEAPAPETAPEAAPEAAPALDGQDVADTAPESGSEVVEITEEAPQVAPAPPQAESFAARAEQPSPEPVFINEPATEQQVEIPAPAEVVVRKQTARMEADFTGLDAVEPASAPQTEPMTDEIADSIAAERFSAASFSPAPESTPTPFAADPELAHKVSELEGVVNTLERENVALNNELKMALKESEDERLSISSENWNLERATMRFNEAERQIKRLGQQLQGERAQCAIEKKDLETQLFDPQITTEQQLAKLAELESRLDDAQEKLNQQRIQYEERIKILEGQLKTQ